MNTLEDWYLKWYTINKLGGLKVDEDFDQAYQELGDTVPKDKVKVRYQNLLDRDLEINLTRYRLPLTIFPPTSEKAVFAVAEPQQQHSSIDKTFKESVVDLRTLIGFLNAYTPIIDERKTD